MKSVYNSRISVSIEGESHSPEMSCELSGIPAGVTVKESYISSALARRAACVDSFSTQRYEKDNPVIESGIVDGVTTGDVIKAVFHNENYNSDTYNEHMYIPRPSHADYPAYVKSGQIPPGGGHYSGRLTLPLTYAGAVCACVLSERGIEIGAHVYSCASIYDEPFDAVNITGEELSELKDRPYPAVSNEKWEQMCRETEKARVDGDSLGGCVECAVTGVPAGLGSHMFKGVENIISTLAFSIPGLKGIEFGSGFYGSTLTGSENNDSFAVKDKTVKTVTNNHGGVLGGMTSGMPLVFRCAFKPVPSIKKVQRSVNLKTLEETELRLNGSFDSCFVPRAVPVVEAVTAIAVLDIMLDSEKPRTLSAARACIDAYDTQIMSLLAKRMELMDTVAMIKKLESVNTFDKSREGDIIAHIKSRLPEELSGAVIAVYREIFKQSKELQDEKRKN